MLIVHGFGAWRSLVAHLPWEQGVGRSNRLAPIFAPVAQGKEQRPSKPRVRGSNPFWRAPQLPKASCPPPKDKRQALQWLDR